MELPNVTYREVVKKATEYIENDKKSDESYESMFGTATTKEDQLKVLEMAMKFSYQQGFIDRGIHTITNIKL